MNSAFVGCELCRSRRMLSIELKAEVDNVLRDLHNSSHHTKAEFNNCFIILSKYFKVLNKPTSC